MSKGGRVWCWVNGWLYQLHKETLDRAEEKGFDWIRPAEDSEVEEFFSKIPEVGK